MYRVRTGLTADVIGMVLRPSIDRTSEQGHLREPRPSSPFPFVIAEFAFLDCFVKMGWQKTFTLARRAKGCHLVTDEILSQITPGLQNVQVSPAFP